MMGKDEIDAELARKRERLAGYRAVFEQGNRDVADAEGDADPDELATRAGQLQEARARVTLASKRIEQTESEIAALKTALDDAENAARCAEADALSPTRLELGGEIQDLTTALVDTVRRYSAIAVEQSVLVRRTGDHDRANDLASTAAVDRYLRTKLAELSVRPTRVLPELGGRQLKAHDVPSLVEADERLLRQILTNSNNAAKAA